MSGSAVLRRQDRQGSAQHEPTQHSGTQPSGTQRRTAQGRRAAAGRLCATLALTGLLGASLALGLGFGPGLVPASQAAVAAQPIAAQPIAAQPIATEVTAPEVTVLDSAARLAPEDEDLLRTETAKIGFPAEVRAVRYLTFARNSSNLNDDVDRLLRAEHPDWMGTNSFAPGELILAVGFNPNQLGVYLGDDVDIALGFSPAKREAVFSAMRPLLQQNRIASALVAGAITANDPAAGAAADAAGPNGWVVAGVLGGGGAAAAAAGSVVWRRYRRCQAQSAREQFDYAQKRYGEIGHDLDAIDIRAHSLTSPLADDALREQWEDVRDRFLAVNDSFGRLEGLKHTSPDKEFVAHRETIATAHTTVTQMEKAKTNIDTLFEMEHGDAGVRRRELARLREDLLTARLELNDADSVVDSTLAELLERLEHLDISATAFMDDYAQVIQDYAVALRAVEQKVSQSQQAVQDQHRAPAIYEDNWRVGTGYASFVPYYLMSTWIAADTSAHQYSSGNATPTYTTNTSFSSGFSGSGGSSSW